MKLLTLSQLKRNEKIAEAMKGVCYGYDNAYPDKPPYNHTDQPRKYFTGIRSASSANNAVMG